jgi:hypothetical protein
MRDRRQRRIRVGGGALRAMVALRLRVRLKGSRWGIWRCL